MKNKNLFTGTLFMLYTIIGTGQDLLTSFESSEGYSLGQVDGQQISANPIFNPSQNWSIVEGSESLWVVSDEKSTDGTYSLKGKLDKGNVTIPNGQLRFLNAQTSDTLRQEEAKSISMDVYLTENGGIGPAFAILVMPAGTVSPIATMEMNNGRIYAINEYGIPGQFGQFNYNSWHNLKIGVENDSIYYYWDDQLLSSAPNSHQSTAIFNIPIGTTQNGGVYVDNMTVDFNFDHNNMSIHGIHNDLDFEYYVQQQKVYCKANHSIEKLTLYNLWGQALCTISGQKNRAQLSIATLQKGIYLINVELEGGLRKTFKIVKR